MKKFLVLPFCLFCLCFYRRLSQMQHPLFVSWCKKKVSRKSVSLNQTRSKLFKRGIKEKETKIFLVPLHTQSCRLRQNQVKFRYCEKATKFEETSHLFFMNLGFVKIGRFKKKISLLRISELYVRIWILKTTNTFTTFTLFENQKFKNNSIWFLYVTLVWLETRLKCK